VTTSRRSDLFIDLYTTEVCIDSVTESTVFLDVLCVVVMFANSLYEGQTVKRGQNGVVLFVDVRLSHRDVWRNASCTSVLSADSQAAVCRLLYRTRDNWSGGSDVKQVLVELHWHNYTDIDAESCTYGRQQLTYCYSEVPHRRRRRRWLCLAGIQPAWHPGNSTSLSVCLLTSCQSLVQLYLECRLLVYHTVFQNVFQMF